MTGQNGTRDDILQLIADRRAKRASVKGALDKLDSEIVSLETTLKIYDEAHPNTAPKQAYIIPPDELRANARSLRAALVYIAKSNPQGIVHYATARDAVMAAGLSTGKPHNVASQLHRIMTEGGDWKKVGAGTFQYVGITPKRLV